MIEAQDLGPDKTLHFWIMSQKKPGYGVSNNWIFFQDSVTW